MTIDEMDFGKLFRALGFSGDVGVKIPTCLLSSCNTPITLVLPVFFQCALSKGTVSKLLVVNPCFVVECNMGVDWTQLPTVRLGV